MIKYVAGDIFDSCAEVIVNPVNTVGIMGKGLALSFKQKYPNMYKTYKEACDNKSFYIGKLMLVSENKRRILLFPTKKHWINPSKLEYIETGLKTFIDCYEYHNIKSIAFPILGCGNGNLNWLEVKPIMEKYLNDISIDVYVYSLRSIKL